MKALTITLSPWKWQGLVCVGATPDIFKAFAKKSFHAEVDVASYSAGHAYVEYGKPWLLWVESLKDVPALAHEALHVASGVLEARGLRLNDASEEAYTYTMEDILRQTLTRKDWKAVK